MQCPACQEDIPPGRTAAQFCPSCGARLDPAADFIDDSPELESELEPEPESEPPGGAIVAAGKLVLSLGTVVFLAALGYSLLSKSGAARQLEDHAAELGETLRGLQSEIRQDQKAVGELKDRLADSKREVSQVEGELATLLASDPRLSNDPERAIVDAREKVRSIEARRQQPAPRPPPPAPTAPAQEKKKAPDPAVEEEVASGRLDAYREAVVTVLSSSRQLATGLIIGESGFTRYVLTISAAAPHGADAGCLFRNGDKSSTDRFILAGATVIYRNERMRMALLSSTSRELLLPRPLGLPKSPPLAAKGDRVFAVGTQVIGGTAFDDNVFEGTVSALDRVAGEFHLLQTTIPASAGSLGAPVVNVRGDLLGLIWQAEEGLEKASLVFPLEALQPMLERLEKEMARGSRDEEAGQTPSRAGAGGQLGPTGVLPYAKADSIDLPRPIEDGLELFPGPSDLLIQWDQRTKRLSAHKRGRPEPLWVKSFQSKTAQGKVQLNTPLSLACVPWAGQALISPGLGRPDNVEMDLKSGKATVLPFLASLSGRQSMAEVTWASFPIGSFRLFALRRGIAIADLAVSKGFRVNLDIIMMARNEDIYTFTTSDGKQVGWFTRSEFLPILVRISAAMDSITSIYESKGIYEDKQAAIAKLQAQIRNYEGELKTGLKLFDAGRMLRDPGQPRASFSQVPGSYLHILGRTVFQIGPSKVTQVGKLLPIRHSASDDAWFLSYFESMAQSCAMASPDGRYAVTETHLFDLKELKPLVELPFPTGPAWFSSSGSHIQAYDRRHQRMVFLGVEDLLANGLGPYGEKREGAAAEKPAGKSR